MLLEKLPIELVQHTIDLVLSDQNLHEQRDTLTILCRVNKALKNQVTALCMRNVQDTRYGAEWWPQVPFLVRFHMAREAIAAAPSVGEKRTIATYMHAVALLLKQYAMLHDPQGTGQFSHKRWLGETASVLALKGADSFHVVLLKQHTKLETAMLEDGKAIDSACPYLKVSKKDPFFTRRNALEWACAHGLEVSALRLVAMAKKQGKITASYLPTAAAVCIMHTTKDTRPLLFYLLHNLDMIAYCPPFCRKLQYCGRNIPIPEWTRKLLLSLAQHKRSEGLFILRKYYPYADSPNIASTLRKEHHWESMKMFMEIERPYCNFEVRDETDA
ncbi:hypothetical protein E8E13_007326 [Curvularia kusanoi]|uniref:Uncharacterized protein n=1 Tax=Curvularia kusanoi TaxID=90978 RepID=A0A9P4TDI7_CURKU|nr:hypothetical protein E8E13_007326 [Curvularia kusanoi]